MGTYYAHMLIAVPDDFAPTAEQIVEFISALKMIGVLTGEDQRITLQTPNPNPPPRRRNWNPFRRSNFSDEVAKIATRFQNKTLASPDDLPVAAVGLADYSVIAFAEEPKISPVLMHSKYDDEVDVVCHVSSSPCSMSWGPEDSDYAAHGKPCRRCPDTGTVVTPVAGKTIRVPHAGAARFWVDFTLGKGRFPEIIDDHLNLLELTILSAAERIFRIAFVQGCSWG